MYRCAIINSRRITTLTEHGFQVAMMHSTGLWNYITVHILFANSFLQPKQQ